MKRAIFFILLSLLSWSAYCQDFTIRGNVSDTKGEPLIGVNVVEDGTVNGTVTDVDGNFILTASGRNAVLKLTYIGYETLQVNIAGKSPLSIIMRESSSELDELWLL